jgi:hypothetical protein
VGFAGVPGGMGGEIAGTTGLVLHAVVIVLFLLFGLRHCRLGPGALAAVLLWNGVLTAGATGMWRYLPAVALAAVAGEGTWLAVRRGAFGGPEAVTGYRLIAVVVPTVELAAYLALAALVGGGIAWPVHVAAGAPLPGERPGPMPFASRRRSDGLRPLGAARASTRDHGQYSGHVSRNEGPPVRHVAVLLRWRLHVAAKLVRARDARLAVACAFLALFAGVMSAEFLVLRRSFRAVAIMGVAVPPLTLYALEAFFVPILVLGVLSAVVTGSNVFFRLTENRLLLETPVPLRALFVLRGLETVGLTS